MLYAILCYDREDEVYAWSKEEDAACMARLGEVQDRLAARGRLGPSARLVPTTAAVTLRKSREELVIDGPFAETKEQLLGFYVMEADDLDGALAFARELAQANPGAGAYEIRPVGLYLDRPAPGSERAAASAP